MSKFNHAIQYIFFGNPTEVLNYTKGNIPIPKYNEVLVKIKARTINPSDLLSITGIGQYKEKIKLPAIPGFEGTGIVIAKGKEVVSPKEGQRIVCMKMRESWQDYLILPAEEALVIPDGIDDNYAAQLCINPLTAWLMIDEYKFNKSKIIIGNAANSTMGKLFAQFAPIFGYQFIGLVRKNIYKEPLLKLGASLVVNSEDKNCAEIISEFTQGKQPDIGVEAVGGKEGQILIHTLRRGSQLILYGSLSLSPFSSEIFRYMREQEIKISSFHLKDWIHSSKLSLNSRKEVFNKMLESMIANKISLPIEKEFKLSDFKQAILAAIQPRNGKIILASDNETF